MQHEHPPPPPPYSPPGQMPSYPHPGQTASYPHPGQTPSYPYPGVHHQEGQATVITATPVIVSQPTTTMIVSQGIYVDSTPTLMTCPSCSNQIVTRVEMTPSCRTHVFALLLCLLIWPCACLPYCIGSCNNADHYCPHCNAFIGAYRF